MTKRNKQRVVEERWNKKQEKGKVQLDKFLEEGSYVQPPVQAKTDRQKEFLRALKSHQVVVFNAPAGVGKSFVTMCEATDWIKKGVYDKMVLSRPSVGMGNTLGLLPGDLRAKYEPFLMCLTDVICQRYGKGFYESSLSNGTLEFQTLEHIRGRSFDQLVILEEAQNTKPDEMYTMLTRIAEGGKLIIIGDPTQNDMKGENGIEWLCRFVDENPELREDVAVIHATSDDIVRSGLCKKMVKAKERSARK